LNIYDRPHLHITHYTRIKKSLHKQSPFIWILLKYVQVDLIRLTSDFFFRVALRQAGSFIPQEIGNFNLINDTADFPYRYHGWLYDKSSLLLAAGKIVP